MVDALTDAFYDYPVMRYVCGSATAYDHRVRRLVELFVSNRAYRNETMYGVRDDAGQLVAVATTTSPDAPEPPAELLALRDAVWTELGAATRDRYEKFAAAAQATAVTGRHHHLNMIGVRRAAHGQGLARPLLVAVHNLCQHDRMSAGVSLTTELLRNKSLYEHFGYAVVGHSVIDTGMQSWTLFRPRDKE
jgi:GNAT superfamily N-acetyltransferase